MTKHSMSYHKFIASAAAVAVVAPIVAPVVSMAASFPDVTEKTTHAEAILALVDAGIIKGNTDGTFKPDAQIKRGDAAVMIARALNLLDGNIPTTTVTDLANSNAVTQEAVAKLVNKGIVSGYPDKTFRPNDTVTRGQMAKYVANAYELPLGDGQTNFPDVDSASDLAKYIDAIAEAGITKGNTNGTFGFGDNLKRGDFAAMVYRAENLKVAPAVEVVRAINDITVTEGGEVTLPTKATVTYEDATTGEVEVTWDTASLNVNTPGTYTLTGTIEGTDKTASVKVIVKAATPKVESVTAINAKQVEVKFNKAVEKSTVLDGSNVVQNITFSPVGTATVAGGLTGSLSADGKTLTITAANSFSGSYTVVASKLIKTTDNKELTEYKTVVSLEDTVRPTLGQAVYNSNNVATFSFSEPIDVADNAALALALTLKDASGATFTPTVVLAADKKSFTLNLSAATFETGKTYTLTASGLKDFAGNLITPNPVTLSVEKKAVDLVNPTVSSVTSSQAGYAVVTFSEKVDVAASTNVVASVGGVTADLDTNASLDASGTVLTVRDASFTGAKDIAVNSFADVAGNAGTARTVLVNFPVDSVKPTVSSSAVKAIDNKNYLVLTFSEDVTVTNAAGSITGTYTTENGVEKAVTAIDASVAANVSAVTGTKNQVKILIDAQEKGNYNVSVPANVVTDVVGNQNDVKAVAYTVGTNTSETTKPTIADATPLTADLDGIVIQAAGDKNTVDITFSEKLATSSLNLNNFQIEDVAVAEKAVFTSDAQTTIRLTLKEGAVKTSGTYNFKVQNVSDVAGNVMLPVTQAKTFTENDLPALTSVALTSNAAASSVITLTFDEAILPVSIVEGTPVADFGIFIDNVAISGATVAEAMGATTNKVTLTIDRPLTAAETAKTITVKPAAGFAVTDVDGNALPTFTSVTVTK